MGANFDRLLGGAAVGGSFGAGMLESRAARARGRAEGRASEINAGLALKEGYAAGARTRRAGRRAIGQQRAALASSGIEASGSPLELIADNAAEIERQAVEQELSGQWAYGVERARGRTARSESRRVSAASLLSGATRSAYYARTLL